MVLADSLIHPSQWDWTTTFIALSLPFVLTYVFTSLQSIIAIRSKKDGKSIPRVPYSIPFVGNAIPFLKDPESYLLSLK